jgi:hypothetical protein
LKDGDRDIVDRFCVFELQLAGLAGAVQDILRLRTGIESLKLYLLVFNSCL